MEFTNVAVHRSLTRQQLMAGCDRELFFMLMLLSGLLFMSGLARFQWGNILAGVIVWITGTAILAKLAVYDAHFKGIVMRSIRYLNPVLPASGKPGMPPVSHKRWD